MTSVRKAFIALIPLVVLTVLANPAAFCGDYEGVKVMQIKKTTATTNGEKISYPKTDSPEVTIVTVEIPPRGETGWHAHPVPVLGYVLSGELVVELEDGKQNRFKEGDAIIEVVNALHNGKNHGNIPVKLFVFYLGAEGRPVATKVEHK